MAKPRAILDLMFGSLVRAHDVAAGCFPGHGGVVIPIGVAEIDLKDESAPNGAVMAFDFNSLDIDTKRLLKLLLMRLERLDDDFDHAVDYEMNCDDFLGDRALESLYRDAVLREFI